VERFYGTGGHGHDSQFIPADYDRFLRSIAPSTPAPPPPPPYDLTADTALLADYDAETLGLANGAVVASWSPSAGAETAPLAQADAAYQPVYETAALNGNPVVSFTGDYLDTGAWAQQHQTPLTVFYVAQFDPATLGTLYGGRNGVYVAAGMSAGILGFLSAGTANVEVPIAAGWHVFCAVYNGAASKFYVDTLTPVTGTTGTGASAALPGLKIGATSSGTTGNLTGKVARAAVVGRAITEQEAVEAMQALATKYALTLV
jgi:hypothetical protein